MRYLLLLVLILPACSNTELKDALKENCLKQEGYRWDANARMCMPPTSQEGPIRYGPTRSRKP